MWWDLLNEFWAHRWKPCMVINVPCAYIKLCMKECSPAWFEETQEMTFNESAAVRMTMRVYTFTQNRHDMTWGCCLILFSCTIWHTCTSISFRVCHSLVLCVCVCVWIVCVCVCVCVEVLSAACTPIYCILKFKPLLLMHLYMKFKCVYASSSLHFLSICICNSHQYMQNASVYLSSNLTHLYMQFTSVYATCVCICNTHLHIQVQSSLLSSRSHARVHAHVCMYVCICVHTCACVYVCVCVRARACAETDDFIIVSFASTTLTGKYFPFNPQDLTHTCAHENIRVCVLVLSKDVSCASNLQATYTHMYNIS